MLVPTTRIAGITVLFVRGLDGISAGMAAMIGDSAWTRECGKAIAALPDVKRPVSCYLGGGEDLVGLRSGVTRALENAETFKVNAIVMPIPRDPTQWVRDTFAYIVEAIRQHADRFQREGHVGLITIVFPTSTHPKTLSDLAFLANPR